MSVRGRLVAGLVFLVLGMAVLVVVWRGLPGGEEASEDGIPTAVPVLFPDAADGVVTAIEVVDHTAGETFAAGTEDGEAWAITQAPAGADLTYGADSARLMGTLIGLPGVRPVRTLTGVDDLAEYGLGDPQYTITFTTAPDGGEHTLFVGAKNPTGESYYTRLTDTLTSGEPVHLISSFTLDPVLAFLTEPPVLLPTPTPPAEGDGE